MSKDRARDIVRDLSRMKNPPLHFMSDGVTWKCDLCGAYGADDEDRNYPDVVHLDTCVWARAARWVRDRVSRCRDSRAGVRCRKRVNHDGPHRISFNTGVTITWT